MATVSAFSTLHSISTPNSHPTPSSKSLITTLPVRNLLHFKPHGLFPNSFKLLTLNHNNNIIKINKFSYSHGLRKLRSVEEEETPLIPEEAAEEEQEVQQEEAEQQTVSIPVSPSDTLTMYFQAEGTMNEVAIPKVTKALEETEGIADLKVQVLEGIASVELTKQTTVQATGVASGLVEVIQGSGFKLQTLNLSFQDEEDLLA